MWEWWHWVILGSVLLVLDIAIINVYYLLWFGIAAVLTGLMLVVFPDTLLWVQVLAFSVLSAAMLALWLLLLRPQMWAKNLSAARQELPGQAGVVVNFNPDQKTGTLRLQKPIGGKDVWEFRADFALRPGERAVIERLGENGIAEVVQKTPTESPAQKD